LTRFVAGAFLFAMRLFATLLLAATTAAAPHCKTAASRQKLVLIAGKPSHHHA
jgi:hypothetical protein